MAGLATNLLAAQIFFVSYLASDGVLGIAPWTFALFAFCLWFPFQVFAIASQQRAVASGGQVSGARRMPRIRRVDSRGLGDLASPTAPPWGYASGLAIAAVLLILAATIGRRWVAEQTELTRLVSSVAKAIAPVTHVEAIAHPELHLLAAILFLSVALAIVILAWAPGEVAPPALSVCALMSMVAALDGLVSFWLRSPGATAAVALPLFVWAGTQRYKVRLADLEGQYRSSPRRPYPPKGDAPIAPGARAVPRAECLAASPHHATPKVDGGPAALGRRPIVLVCASGGGIRAATWTAGLLGRLDRIPHWIDDTWMITGASGGMVGAAMWTAALRAARAADRDPVAWRSLIDAVARDGLSTAAQALTFGDFPRTVLPFPNRIDRGAALEQAWIGNVSRIDGLDVDLGAPVAALAEDEARGVLPSLVFSPMVVEDGRRLMVSNLSLAPAVTNRIAWLDESGQATEGTASVSAYHARDLFGDAGFARITLATAARLSASFPYVSPAAHLPTEPPRRVVDAGYFDNYGVELACSWLERCLEVNHAWIRDRVSGILVLQIRDSEVSLTLGGDLPADSPPPPPPRTSALARAAQGVTSPPEGVLSARQSVMLFRNDAQLHAVASLFRQRFGSGFLATSIFELKADVSLSWALSRAERALIAAQLASPGIVQKLAAVERWISDHRDA